MMLLVFLVVFAVGCAPKVAKDALSLTPESLQDRQAQTRYFDTTGESMLLSASAQVLQDLGFNLDESEMALGVLVGSKNRDATDAGQVVASIFLGLFTGVSVPTDHNQVIRVSLVTRPLENDSEPVEEGKKNELLRQEIVETVKTRAEQMLGEELTTKLDGKVQQPIIEGLCKTLAHQMKEDLDRDLHLYLESGRTAVRITFQRTIFNTRGEISCLEAINEPKVYQEFFDKLSQSVFLEAHEI